NSTHKLSPPNTKPNFAKATHNSSRASKTTAANSKPHTKRSSTHCAKAAPSRPPLNGWSTTTTSSKSNCARSDRICRRAITTSFPNSRKANSPAIHEFTPSHSPSSYTLTRASTPTPCNDSSLHIKQSRRSRSASCGPSPLLCDSLSSKTCAVSQSPSLAPASSATKPTNSPTSCSSKP